ncbi:MAG: hypothetical protein RIT28_3344, partial [Pseudomonadota bacterium]
MAAPAGAQAPSAILRAARLCLSLSGRSVHLHVEIEGDRVVEVDTDARALLGAEPAQAIGTLLKLDALRGVWRRLSAPGGRALIVIQADTPSLQALPWERLTFPPPAAKPVVVRVTSEPSARSPSPWGLRLVGYAPPGDLQSERRLATLAPSCTKHHLSPPVPLSSAPRDTDDAQVLWLVGRPAALTEAIDGAVSAWLPVAELVVFALVGEESRSPRARSRLAEQAVELGARAALAFADPNVTTVTAAQDAAVLAALVEEAPLWRLAQLGDAPVLLAGGLDALHQPAALRAWRPAGWRLPGPEAAARLDAARRYAQSRGSAYVGVEHLCEVARSGPTPRRPQGPRPWLHLDRLARRAPDWTGTPRLKALGLDLPEGFGLPELEQALAAAERPGAEAPATSLEVLGGPEDGRLFVPQPGEWLGRDIPGLAPDHALYTDAPLTDPFLSRRALEWLGPGRLSLPRAVTREDGEIVG